MNTLHYTDCPVCGSTDIKNVLSVIDYSVSGETFVIAECGSCTLRFTQDVPDAVSIGPYYQSENYISHTNTSRGLINRLYQYVRGRTMKKKRKLLEKGTGMKKGNLLDLGCGIGTFVHEMKEQGWQATGIEPDAGARKIAKKLYDIDLSDSIDFYKLNPGSFDAITLWHVLEHVHDLIAYVRQLKTLLKEQGRIFIAVPNYTSKDASVYKNFWAAYDVPRHLYHFSPRSLEVLLERNGLKLLDCRPMWYDSYYISLLSSKYKNKGKANFPAACWNGFRSNLAAMGNVRKCSSIVYVISNV